MKFCTLTWLVLLNWSHMCNGFVLSTVKKTQFFDYGWLSIKSRHLFSKVRLLLQFMYVCLLEHACDIVVELVKEA